MRRFLIYFLSIALLILPLVATAEERLIPRIVLLERDPWLMVIGSDSPSFALYSNGRVIFKKKVGKTARFVTAQLSDKETEALLDLLKPDSVHNAKKQYALSMATDQVDNELHFWSDGKRRDVWVYGPLRAPKKPEINDYAKYNEKDRQPLLENDQKYFDQQMALRDEVPKELLALLDTIANFNMPAEPWSPSEVEVFIWPYDYSPETPLSWPENWPPIKDAEHGEDDYHKFSLPISELDRLRTLMSSLGQKQAIQIEGRKWAISYRLPFPGESRWQQ